MMNRKELKILMLSAAIALPVGVSAMTPLSMMLPCPVASATTGSRLETARNMYDKGNYRGALDELHAFIISSELPLPSDAEQEFLYLLGGSAFMADSPETLSLLDDYIESYPAGEDAIEVKLLKADYYFFRHDWSEALEIYRATNFSGLDKSARLRATYREALCMIKCGFYEEAVPLLKEIGKDKEYYLAYKYYLAYIYYMEGRDVEALTLFQEVEKSVPTPKNGVENSMAPEYYIAQLLFRRGEWAEAASKASGLIKGGNSENPLYAPMLRVLGLSRYEQGDYAAAQTDLSKYVKIAGEDASADAIYALGVCRYFENDFVGAEECFVKVVESHDAIGQGASLYLGQLAARRDDASAAALNFERAYRMNYDNKVAEAALYDYVAARARGGNIPFDSNVEMLEEFIRNYPDSEYAPLIERHLAGLYYSDGDYDNALRIADRIKSPTSSDISLLQAILYSGGTSALSAGNPSKASRLLKRCVEVKGGNPEIAAQAEIWLGDALYDLGEFAGAEKAYLAAEKSGKARNNAMHLRYNLGYAQLMQNKFAEASRSFNTMLSSTVDIPRDLRRDALLRIADCKYYAGNYAEAKHDFEALTESGHGADYALYRHAQILGIEGRLGEKIAELKRFESQYGESRWISNALTELADTYVDNGQNKEGAAAYERLLTKFPLDPAAPRARLGMGAALMASGDGEGGAKAYEDVIKRWPSSEQAQMADKELREYYAQTHRLQEYAEFINSIPGFSINAAEMEALAYNVAEREYLDYPTSVISLNKYLEEYPEGAHSAEAWELIARHYYDAGDKRKALAAYRELEKRGGSEYALEAYAGIMRTADNVADRGEYARKLRDAGSAQTDIMEEAEFYIAEADLKGKDSAKRKEAEKTLRNLAKNYFSEFGARSAVTLGEYLLGQKKVKDAHTLMDEFTSSGSGQQYWVARGFIVLSDVIEAEGDHYTAQEYLRSLKRNYPGDEADIQREIEKRLKGRS